MLQSGVTKQLAQDNSEENKPKLPKKSEQNKSK